MITYAERACFRPEHLQLLSRAQTYVARVSDTWGNELRCHELARAVQRVAEIGHLVVVDGKCGPVEHSWLRFSDGVILDPYAPGRLPAVQMIDPLVGSSYRSGEDRTDIRQAIVDQLVLEMTASGATLSCPFCGLDPKAMRRPSSHTATGEFHCIVCYCGGYVATAWKGGESHEAVLAAWNTRS